MGKMIVEQISLDSTELKQDINQLFSEVTAQENLLLTRVMNTVDTARLHLSYISNVIELFNVALNANIDAAFLAQIEVTLSTISTFASIAAAFTVAPIPGARAAAAIILGSGVPALTNLLRLIQMQEAQAQSRAAQQSRNSFESMLRRMDF